MARVQREREGGRREEGGGRVSPSAINTLHHAVRPLRFSLNPGLSVKTGLKLIFAPFRQTFTLITKPNLKLSV